MDRLILLSKMNYFIYDNPDNTIMSVTARKDGEEVGTSHTKICDCFMSSISIFPSRLQRQGFGTLLLDKTEEEAKKRGCEYMSLYPCKEVGRFYYVNGYSHAWYDVFNVGNVHKQL